MNGPRVYFPLRDFPLSRVVPGKYKLLSAISSTLTLLHIILQTQQCGASFVFLIQECGCLCDQTTPRYGGNLCYGVSPCYSVSLCCGGNSCYGVNPCSGVNLCYGVFLCYGVNPCYGAYPCDDANLCYGVSLCQEAQRASSLLTSSEFMPN